MTFLFRDITVRIGNAVIVEGAASELKKGEVTALIGPNGAGKSTLLTALAGLRAFEGAVYSDAMQVTAKEQRARVAYMPQDIGAQSSLTAIEVVLLGRLRSLGLTIPGELVAEAVAALDTFGLSHLQGRNLSEVSGGQRQLIYLTQALFRKPDLLLLDEPTASLDLRHQLIVLDAVRSFIIRHDMPVVIAIHDISLAAQFADRIICISDGRIDISDETRTVLRPERLQRVFGVEVEITESGSGHLRITPLRAAGTQSRIIRPDT